jgi:hypothetical protein
VAAKRGRTSGEPNAISSVMASIRRSMVKYIAASGRRVRMEGRIPSDFAVSGCYAAGHGEDELCMC